MGKQGRRDAAHIFGRRDPCRSGKAGGCSSCPFIAGILQVLRYDDGGLCQGYQGAAGVDIVTRQSTIVDGYLLYMRIFGSEPFYPQLQSFLSYHTVTLQKIIVKKGMMLSSFYF